MTMLEKIVFTADYIEPGRDHAPNLPELRQLAFIDLDQAVCRILEQGGCEILKLQEDNEGITRAVMAQKKSEE